MAKAFTFSLGKVLKYRADIEDTLAVKMKRSVDKLKIEKHHLHDLEFTKEMFFKEGNDPDTITLNSMKISTEYVGQLNSKLKLKEMKVESDFQTSQANKSTYYDEV